MVMNITNGTLLGANNYVSGRFLPHSLCFGVVTQQETYYIILVSSSVQVIYHLRPLHTCDIWGCLQNYYNILSLHSGWLCYSYLSMGVL